MPPYTVDLVPNEPIILEVLGEDYQTAKHLLSSIGEINQQLDAARDPLILIMDLRQAPMGLDDIIAGANAATRMSGMLKHPKLRRSIIVSDNRMMELAARGMNTPIFGHIKMEVSKTLEEAMEMARQ
jgi:hypothetical protein